MVKKQIVIVGAGVIGLHCAYYLRRNGHDVLVIDQIEEDDESGCSYGNCGYTVPSHFIPLASPAMLKSGLKLLFDPKSPVHLPLFKNAKNVPWFWNFLLSSTANKVKNAGPVLFALNSLSSSLYQNIYTDIAADSNNYKQNGLLLLSTTKKGWDEEIETAETGLKMGMDVQVLSAKEVAGIEPGVDWNIKGGVMYRLDGMLNPEVHMRLLKQWLKNNGVRFQYGETVRDITISKGKVDGIGTQSKKYQADEYVIATGAYSQQIARKVNLYLPVISGKGYSLDFPSHTLRIETPFILTEAKVAVSPFEQTIRIGSGMELNGVVGDVSLRRVEAMLNRTKKAVPSFKEFQTDKTRIWEGLRPVSPDGIPFIGRTQKVRNLLFATGHAMMGMSLGPVTGKLISEQVNGEGLTVDSPLFHPDRFH